LELDDDEETGKKKKKKNDKKNPKKVDRVCIDRIKKFSFYL